MTITRRKLFGFLAALPFAKAIPTLAQAEPQQAVTVSAWSGETTIGYIEAGYDAARNFDATAIVTVSWNPVPGATSYRIYSRPKT